MNGDRLLATFLEYIYREKPPRFFGYPEENKQWQTQWELKVAREACYGAYDAVLFRYRNGLIIEVIPVEVKGDTDVLDERLRSQIWVHINNFGESMLVLDKNQIARVKKLKLQNMLPTEIWAFDGVLFQQVTESIWRYSYNDGDAQVSKRVIEKVFGVHDSAKLSEIQRKVFRLSSLLYKLAANQWRFGEEEKFTREEQKIANLLLGVKMLSDFQEAS